MSSDTDVKSIQVNRMIEEQPVIIPAAQLSEDVLNGIIAEFVLREGTDYGHGEFTLDEKIETVKQQIKSGKAQVVYDLLSESCTLQMAK